MNPPRRPSTPTQRPLDEAKAVLAQMHIDMALHSEREVLVEMLYLLRRIDCHLETWSGRVACNSNA